jgi:hypothetical protein
MLRSILKSMRVSTRRGTMCELILCSLWVLEAFVGVSWDISLADDTGLAFRQTEERKALRVWMEAA